MAWCIAALGEDAKTGRRLVAYCDELSAWACIESEDSSSDKIEFSVENLSTVAIGLNFQASHADSFFTVQKDGDSSVLVSFRLANEATVSKARLTLQEFKSRLDALMPGRPHPLGRPWLGP